MVRFQRDEDSGLGSMVQADGDSVKEVMKHAQESSND